MAAKQKLRANFEMKLVHIVPALTKGGGERVAIDLANHAAAAGHHVTVLAGFPVDPTLLENDLRPDVEIRFIAPAGTSKTRLYLALPSWLWRNRWWLTDQEVIHCHLTLGAVAGTLIQAVRKLRGRTGPAVVETYHAVGMPIPNLHRRIHAAMAARRDALALMAEDEYWRAFLAKRPRLISAVIPNGVSIPHPVSEAERLAYRRQLGLPDSCRHVVGTVGRLSPERRPSLYFPIFARVAEVLGPQVHFILAGGGSESDRMRGLVVKHGLEGRVHLPGTVKRPAVAQAAMDVYLTVVVESVAGLGALEAAGAGVPVLAIQLIPSYRSSPGEMFWSSTNLMEIADRAIALLRSPGERRALAKRQSLFVQTERSVEEMAHRYERLYRAALDKLERRQSIASAP
jgi:glycosyltransferase involved in cell wall biosynthesis